MYNNSKFFYLFHLKLFNFNLLSIIYIFKNKKMKLYHIFKLQIVKFNSLHVKTYKNL